MELFFCGLFCKSGERAAGQREDKQNDEVFRIFSCAGGLRDMVKWERLLRVF